MTGKNLLKLSEEISHIFDRMQKTFIKHAQEAGHSRDMFKAVGFFLEEELQDETLRASVEASLNGYKAFILAKEKQMVLPDLSATAGVVVSTAVSSVHVSHLAMQDANWGVTAEPKTPVIVLPKGPFYPTPNIDNELEEYFNTLSIELGKTYRSIWEIFYGTGASPERQALYSMRQLYDDFFRLLSPDDKVRNSSYFQQKEGNKPNLVTRSERMRYAANTLISDKQLAETLESQIQAAIAIYEKLNEAHKPGSLDREIVKEVLSSMQGILGVWVKALKQTGHSGKQRS